MNTRLYVDCSLHAVLLLQKEIHHVLCILSSILHKGFTSLPKKKKLYFPHLKKAVSVLNCIQSSLLQLRNRLFLQVASSQGSFWQLLIHHRIPMKKMYPLLFSHCHAFLHLMKRMPEGEEKPVYSAFKLRKQEEQFSSHNTILDPCSNPSANGAVTQNSLTLAEDCLFQRAKGQTGFQLEQTKHHTLALRSLIQIPDQVALSQPECLQFLFFSLLFLNLLSVHYIF